MEKVIIQKGSDAIWATFPNSPGSFICGESLQEIKQNSLDAINDLRDNDNLLEFADLEFIYDLGSFFNLEGINTSYIAKRIGINRSLLAQYLKGDIFPNEETLKKINAGVKEWASEMLGQIDNVQDTREYA